MQFYNETEGWNPDMDVRLPASCSVDLASGIMHGATGRYEKRLADLRGIYEDEAEFDRLVEQAANPVVYEVTEFRPSTESGDLIFGLTRMVPGKVGREFFLTRGHIHAKADRPEIYYGQRGRGLMLMESPAGETRVVEIGPQTICYVPPFWIHRSVNVGEDDLLLMFGYPADSGQDYDIIIRAGGMRHRVMAAGDGGWTLAENPRYRPRASGESAEPAR
jgi:glucose-6-phosphate isomerase